MVCFVDWLQDQWIMVDLSLLLTVCTYYVPMNDDDSKLRWYFFLNVAHGIVRDREVCIFSMTAKI